MHGIEDPKPRPKPRPKLCLPSPGPSPGPGPGFAAKPRPKPRPRRAQASPTPGPGPGISPPQTPRVAFGGDANHVGSHACGWSGAAVCRGAGSVSGLVMGSCVVSAFGGDGICDLKNTTPNPRPPPAQESTFVFYPLFAKIRPPGIQGSLESSGFSPPAIPNL